jgi:hypothetical protein
MRSDSRRAWLALVLFAPIGFVGPGPAGAADDFKVEEGFETLFNGKDLTGWRVGKEVLDGKTESSDHRFAAKDGSIVTQTGKPVENIDTVREFTGDLVLRLEFRAAPKANSGLFVRGNQLQIRDYPTVGPYKDLKRFNNGDWNAIEVTVKGSTARCTCNGEVLEEAMAVPAKGGIGLQSETNQLEYRRLRIKELR